MNVGYLYGFNSYPPRNGGSIHAYNLTRNLMKLGCRIHAFEPEENPQCVIYPTSDEGIASWLNAIDVIYMRVDGWYLSKSRLKVNCLKRTNSKPVVWEVNASSEELLQKKKASLAKNGASRSQPGQWLRRERYLLPLRLELAREEKFRRRQARGVNMAICVSSALAQYAVRDLKIRRLQVIPNGSDPDFFHPGLRDDRLFPGYEDYYKVVFSGDVRYPWQGFGFVEEMALRAEKEGRKIVFVVLSNTPVEHGNLCKNLLLLDPVEYSNVPAYLASADVCLCLYKEGCWSKYGFHLSPLKLFDYMACGKPVVASRLGQIATVIEDGKDGWLTSGGLDSIYQRVVFCQENQGLALQMGKAVREKIVRYYNWERAARQTIEVFEIALKEQRNQYGREAGIP